jgi:hypothetical protein
MRPTHSMGVVLVAAMWMGFHSPMALAATAWSTNAAACVPVSAAGVSIAAGAVTAKAGTTVTLYCGVTQGALTGGFDSIEITYKGGVSVVSGGGSTTRAAAVGPQFGGSVTSELVEMSKTSGAETVRCGIQPPGSTGIVTKSNLCNNSNLDFNNNFYYLRIVLRSGIIAGQQETVYGSSLIGTR